MTQNRQLQVDSVADELIHEGSIKSIKLFAQQHHRVGNLSWAEDGEKSTEELDIFCIRKEGIERKWKHIKKGMKD